MYKTLTRMLIIVTAMTAGSSAYAFDSSHSASTTFCPTSRQAHGLCKSTHEGGFADAIRLNCSIRRNGVVKTRHNSTVEIGEKSSSTRLRVHTYLNNNAWYCTHNNNRFMDDSFFGRIVHNPQANSTQDCALYTQVGSGEETH